MAEDGFSQDPSSSLMELRPKGPTLVGDEECRCALQEKTDTEAWRGIDDCTHNIYAGQTGKWFLKPNETNRDSLKDSPSSSNCMWVIKTIVSSRRCVRFQKEEEKIGEKGSVRSGTRVAFPRSCSLFATSS